MFWYLKCKCISMDDTVFIILVVLTLDCLLQNVFRHYIALVTNHVSKK